MGCAQSSSASEEDRVNSHIDQELRREKALARKTTKMLLLGAGESGKSTIVKQLKLMHQGTYSPDERLEYRDVILANTVQSMQAILDALPELNLRIDGELAVDATTVLKCEGYFAHDLFCAELAQPIANLAQCRVVREAIARRREFQLNDSAEYYFGSLAKMASPDYLPSDEDILRARVKTTGVIEHQIKIKDQLFKVTDVGGQRSERKKWLNVFADIQVLLWVVSLSEYDQVLREDSTVSRMEEASQLFSATINSKWFENSTIMLFLNKIDLFAAKLRTQPINKYILDFPPEHNTDVEWAAKFMRQKFIDLYRPRGAGRQLYSHLTTATETRAMRAVLNAVTDSVMKQQLNDTGLL